jgi:hypothetical protein
VQNNKGANLYVEKGATPVYARWAIVLPPRVERVAPAQLSGSPLLSTVMVTSVLAGSRNREIFNCTLPSGFVTVLARVQGTGGLRVAWSHEHARHQTHLRRGPPNPDEMGVGKNQVPACVRGHAFAQRERRCFPKRTHRFCGKAQGETHHAKRFFGTLHSRLGRLVRRAYSFSKSVERHLDAIHRFSVPITSASNSQHWVNHHRIFLHITTVPWSCCKGKVYGSIPYFTAIYVVISPPGIEPGSKV